MDLQETLKLAAVEDDMWYFRGLHAHVSGALQRAGLKPGATVLDAGCGTGGLIRRISGVRPGIHWKGIDINPDAVALARERTRGLPVELAVGSVTRLPWDDAVFDAAVSMDVLYHVEDDALSLRECLRVLKPGGNLWLNVPAHSWLWSYHDVATSAVRRYDRKALLELVGGAGFDVLEWTHWNSLLLPLIAFRRKVLPQPAEGSDVMKYPPLLDGLFSAVLLAERYCIQAGLRFPMGSSLWIAARKPDGDGKPQAPQTKQQDG
jgi:SAM-dependent methyltransferase